MDAEAKEVVVIDLVEITCAKCGKPPTTLLKVVGDSNTPKEEIYCRTHGLEQREILIARYTRDKIEFKDLTF
jgi:hypothetical protein